jgi:hypothetical protein
MTEPIKLPPLPRPPIHLSGWTNELCEWAKNYARLAVEQAAADLRERLAKAEADSNVWAERYRKAALERDEAQDELARLTELLSDVRAVEAELAEKSDELARLTTLRPYEEHAEGAKLYWVKDGSEWVCDPLLKRPSHWTPLPDVKEAKP